VSLKRSISVVLRVLDILGQEVTTLLAGRYEPGTYSVDWDASDKPSGIYFCRMETEDLVTVRHMVLLT
jgi:hypothetical protein